MTIADIEDKTSLVMDIVIQGAFEELKRPPEEKLTAQLKEQICGTLEYNPDLLRGFKSKRGNYIASQWVTHWLKGLIYRERVPLRTS